MPQNRRNTKSPYTADREIPGAFAGETVTRRRFMTGVTHTAGAVAAGAFTLPALAFAVGPIFHRNKQPWVDVGPASKFTPDTYVPVVFSIVPDIGEPGKTTAFVRQHNESVDGPVKDEWDHYVALSSRCMHLGCPVSYKQAAERFICPCHGGVYDFRGDRVGGPPVRPLDRFYTRVKNGRLQLGPRYSVNSEFHRFSPRDPAEPLDGIGQYLYPSRFSTSPRP